MISILGPPEELLSDNGAAFRSKEVKEVCVKWEIKQSFSCAYRPKGNGVGERVYLDIKRQ